MIPKKRVPDLIRDGNRFSDEIMVDKGLDHDLIPRTRIMV
jgi:hypothetical protein